MTYAELHRHAVEEHGANTRATTQRLKCLAELRYAEERTCHIIANVRGVLTAADCAALDCARAAAGLTFDVSTQHFHPLDYTLGQS